MTGPLNVGGYFFMPGARLQPGAAADPQVVGEHLERLTKRAHGQLTPELVLRDARRANSPIHSFFEWEDDVAAEKYRLGQARGLVRAVGCHLSGDLRGPVKTTHAYVHIKIEDSGRGYYQPIEQAMNEPGTRDIILRQAIADANAWRRRYAELSELAAIFTELEKLAAPPTPSPPEEPPATPARRRAGRRR